MVGDAAASGNLAGGRRWGSGRDEAVAGFPSSSAAATTTCSCSSCASSLRGALKQQLAPTIGDVDPIEIARHDGKRQQQQPALLPPPQADPRLPLQPLPQGQSLFVANAVLGFVIFRRLPPPRISLDAPRGPGNGRSGRGCDRPVGLGRGNE